ncbi:ABC transporter ATP-binding protein [Sciscionella marina]|uniref:ABC transporter ATP-binding protein n=1 Tax=Sciscionella marina TaxID=508770 RepID=UPI000376C33A|nr:ABC transporter ATP-binding protein [Sciscionella marina]
MTELRFEDLGWSVRGTEILRAIGFTVPQGELVGLLGRNGSGKSSLLQLAAGLRTPSTGRVLAGDRVVGELGNRERARLIAFLAQQADTELALTVAEVVALGRTPHRNSFSATESDDTVREAMHRTEVAQLSERSWSTLSGGERQRTQLARAIAQQPSLLLLDEPTNHLDLAHQIGLLRLVRELGITTLTALHDLELAAAFCDRLAVLDAGRLVAYGTPDEVLTPELLAEVYAVSARVLTHPITGRPHIQWNP